jgi:hypothetical protein
MYFGFSLDKIVYNFKIFIKINEGFECRYRYWADNRKANSGQRQLTPILRIKHLCGEDYIIEVYNAGELILDKVVNLDVRYKKANYIGL